MKKVKLSGMLTLALLMTMGLKLSAQTNVIKINPLSLFVLTGNVKYERTFADKMSAQLGVYYGGIGLGGNFEEVGGGFKYSWWGVTPEFRYYVTNGSKDAPEGFYVGPYAIVRNFSAKYTVTYTDPDDLSTQTGRVGLSAMTFGGGLMFGYQFLFGDVVTLESYLGGHFATGTAKLTADDSGDELDVDTYYSGRSAGIGIGVRWGLVLGFAF